MHNLVTNKTAANDDTYTESTTRQCLSPSLRSLLNRQTDVPQFVVLLLRFGEIVSLCCIHAFEIARRLPLSG